MTSYRREVRRQLIYGNLKRFVELQREKNVLLLEIGCTPYSVRSPAFGTLHELTLEAEFASLAEFERQAGVIAATPAIGRIDADQLGLVVQGGASDRLSKTVLDLVPDPGQGPRP